MTDIGKRRTKIGDGVQVMDDLISRQVAISEEKMRIVIDNYFKSECNVNTSIRQAFEKGFKIGVKKGLTAQPEIIRCKECAYCVIDPSDGLPYCPEFYERTVEPDDYCSKAVRKKRGELK